MKRATDSATDHCGFAEKKAVLCPKARSDYSYSARSEYSRIAVV